MHGIFQVTAFTQTCGFNHSENAFEKKPIFFIFIYLFILFFKQGQAHICPPNNDKILVKQGKYNS